MSTSCSGYRRHRRPLVRPPRPGNLPGPHGPADRDAGAARRGRPPRPAVAAAHHRSPDRRPRDGRHRGVLVRAGLRPGAPDAVRAVGPGGMPLGLRHRDADGRRGPPGGLAEAGGRAHRERRSGHAVRRARRHPRSTTDGPGGLLEHLLGGRRFQRRPRAPGEPADAVGARRREASPLPRPGASRQQAVVRRSLRHPIRGDRLHPKPSTRPPRRARRGDGHQPRMRPRKGVTASLVGSPEEESARPNLRLRIVGIAVLILFGVLVLRLWTLQVVEGKSFAAAVNRNQVRVVSIAAPRGEIIDRNNTVLVTNVPQEEILLSRAEAAQHPEIIGMVAALLGGAPPHATAAINNNRHSPYEPVPLASNVSPATVQYLQTPQAQYPGVSVETATQRTYPQGGAP